MARLFQLAIFTVAVSACLAFSVTRRRPFWGRGITRPPWLLPSRRMMHPPLGPPVSPTDEMSVRIASNGLPHQGTVIVTYRGQDGLICDDNWDMADARVVCRMLGYSEPTAAYSRNHFSHWMSDRDFIMFDEVGCTGDERTLAACELPGYMHHDCELREAAGVGCTGSFYRLEGGNAPNEGTVVMQSGPTVGVVCDDGWDLTDASVVCKSLGYSGASEATTNNTFNYQGTEEDIMYDEVNCTGEEEVLDQCTHRGVGRHDCEVREIAGVKCTGDNSVTVSLAGGSSDSEGTVLVSHGGITGVVCDDGWGISDAQVVCRMLGYRGALRALGENQFNYTGVAEDIVLDEVQCSGDDENLMECRHEGLKHHDCDVDETAGVVCDVGDDIMTVSLTGGRSDLEGTVVVEYKGHRGVICDDDWGQREGEIVCKMLGFRGLLSVTTRNQYGYHGNDSNILLDDLACTGEEVELSQCEHSGFREHNCDISETAGVVCLNTDDVDVMPVEVQLVGGASENEGTVLVSQAGHSGVICDDFWDITDANVVCRMLGYTRALHETSNNHFNFIGDEMDILLDDVHCMGDEESLLDCRHRGLKRHNCRTHETAGVVCDTGELTTPPPYPPTTPVSTAEVTTPTPTPVVTVTTALPYQDTDDAMTVELVGGASDSEGTVLVTQAGQSGMVCDDYWDIDDATVVCRSLGYPGALFETTNNHFTFVGFHTDILLDDVNCHGGEDSLADCQHAGLNNHNCMGHEAAGVVCDTGASVYVPTCPVMAPGTAEPARRLADPQDGCSFYSCDDQGVAVHQRCPRGTKYWDLAQDCFPLAPYETCD